MAADAAYLAILIRMRVCSVCPMRLRLWLRGPMNMYSKGSSKPFLMAPRPS